jgi:hypothetical protein
MSTFYQDLDRAGGFDYHLCQLPNLGWRTFRGPPADTSKPYLAFLGSAQTFGRFCERPFPSLLGSRLKLGVLNLSVGGAGPRHFQAPAYLDLVNGAEAVIVQILSGRSASNSLFDNSRWGNHEGQRRLDGATMRSEDFFRKFAETASPEEITKVVQETRHDYTQAFAHLLQEITAPKILFWFSTKPPSDVDDCSDMPASLFRGNPQLVNRRMLNELTAYADAFVECVSASGIPQKLWESEQSIAGATSRAGVLENTFYPSPEMHLEAADALEKTCRQMTGRYDPPAENGLLRKFVIVAAERTGTNLLIGMLRDYPDCECGYELFNSHNIARDIIPWRNLPADVYDDLLALRKADPLGFWNALCGRSEASGFRAAGFKLLYGHGLEQPELLDALVADESLLVIHLTRRNLLRRAISEEQARVSGKWAERSSDPPTPRAPVALTAIAIAQDIELIQQHQKLYEDAFKGHDVLRIFYEDLATRPQHVAARTAGFLGLPPGAAPPGIKWRKTGSEELSAALLDVESLRAQLPQWAAFFD